MAFIIGYKKFFLTKIQQQFNFTAGKSGAKVLFLNFSPMAIVLRNYYEEKIVLIWQIYQNKFRGNEEVINILRPVVENFSGKIPTW